MFPYLSIFSFLVVSGAALNERKSRQLLPLVALFLLFFMGTRYFVGCDFTGYMSRYEHVRVDFASWTDLFKHEGGFGFIMSALQDAGADYMWLNFTCTAIFIACLVRFCQSFQRPLMIVALLFPVVIIQLAMSGLRQADALGFLMLAVVEFVQRRRVMTGVYIVAASLFHVSAIVFLPIAFLAGREISGIRLLLAILLLTPAAGLLLASRVDVYLDRYVDQIYGEVSAGGAWVRYVLIVVPAVLFMRYRQRMRLAFPQMYPLFMLFALMTFGLAGVGAVSSLILHRLTFYMMPVTVLMLVYGSLLLAPRRKHALQRYLPAFMYGAYCLSWLMSSRHAALCYIPYRSYLFM